MGHAEFAFEHTIALAEIAWHQGLDLYALDADRLTAFMETTAALRLGAPVDPRAYGGRLNAGNGLNSAVYEMAYAHYHGIMGMSLPNTERLIDQVTRKVTAKLVDAPFPADLPQTIFGRRIWGQGTATLTHGQ